LLPTFPKASPRSLSGLLPFLRPYRDRIALAVVFLVLAAMATLVFPVALRGLIDGGFSASDKGAQLLALRQHFVELFAGAVTLIQRFGSAANLNIHLHGLVLDGVYYTSAEGAPVFRPAPALTGEELQALLGKIITRVLRRLTREGHLVEEEGVTYVADTHGIIDPENVLAPLQAASCTYRIALGPRAGRKVLSLQYAASRAAPITQPLCANAHGFSLHAGCAVPPSNAASLSTCAATSRARPSPTSG
jgi:hypothetical protein